MDTDRNISERGPWDVMISSDGKSVGLISGDFTHDVVLRISGDFIDFQQKVEYAYLLASRMNRMPKE